MDLPTFPEKLSTATFMADLFLGAGVAGGWRSGYVRQHGRIQRSDVMELCRLTEGQAKDLLKRLKASCGCLAPFIR
ncbi:hypothetical protein [Pelomonas sp. KK5]|uniref:hypothetical protein n=1 Tax=Pelomonas sp. KK5 TaxID=1855730 RepID=UPI001301C409|nr:hypothetical protein [Pelomonas sp. KK5]